VIWSVKQSPCLSMPEKILTQILTRTTHHRKRG
jgi:hypothetical protein